ncbi:hypothetical protein HispidOSU_003324, partial [Sigmodon hispidus]
EGCPVKGEGRRDLVLPGNWFCKFIFRHRNGLFGGGYESCVDSTSGRELTGCCQESCRERVLGDGQVLIWHKRALLHLICCYLETMENSQESR